MDNLLANYALLGIGVVVALGAYLLGVIDCRFHPTHEKTVTVSISD